MKKTEKIISPFKISSFNFNGELDDIYAPKNQIKHIKLNTAKGKYWIKISKKLREQISELSPGCQLEIAGQSKQSLETGKIKYKAQTIALIAQNAEQIAAIKTKQVSLLPVFDPRTKFHAKLHAKVLICQKANCWKNGGREVFASLESALSDRGLRDIVNIKKTGCLKKCKKAPNLIVFPDKVHYAKVKPKQVSSLIDKHLIAKP